MKSVAVLFIASLLGTALALPAVADDIVAPPPAAIQYKGIGIDFGGFLALESVYRSNNMESDVDTKYSAIPFQANATSTTSGDSGYGFSEFRETARQSRFSLLAKGNVDSSTQLAGYYELDFLGAAPTANSSQSNSYNPRTRHVYATADWNDSGWHILAGQTWTLLMMNAKGITPRNEVVPATIDAQYSVGFSWARQPQLRITKDWNKEFWLALSIENAQTVNASGVLPTGLVNNNQITAGNLFASGTTMSLNGYPDLIAKFAWEASFGHFEAFDLLRNFQSRYGTGTGSASSATITTGTKQSLWADAFGGGVSIPLLGHMFDLTLSGLYGSGGGRYGTTQLADATYGADGSLNPLKATQYLGQLTWHAAPTFDAYATYGQEKVAGATGVSGAAYGYGDNVVPSNLGCTFMGGSCSPEIKQASQLDLGVWWSFYKGGYGTAKLGGQYSHTQLATFADANGLSPTAKIDMAFASIRFYPF